MYFLGGSEGPGADCTNGLIRWFEEFLCFSTG